MDKWVGQVVRENGAVGDLMLDFSNRNFNNFKLLELRKVLAQRFIKSNDLQVSPLTRHVYETFPPMKIDILQKNIVER